MSAQHTVLLVGGTGRTGQHVLKELLKRGISVRAVVRSVHKLPPGAAQLPNLKVIEASLLSQSDNDLLSEVRDCNAVISCLGHVLNVKGIFGPPRDLVTQATTRLCRAIESLQPAQPVKFILMSSVSVNHPGGIDVRRGAFDKVLLWILRGLVPPARDNQGAADFLYNKIGINNPFVEWVTVRPDTLLDGEMSAYALQKDLVTNLFAPESTTMANIGHFMCELVANPEEWKAWKCQLPVIFNSADSKHRDANAKYQRKGTSTDATSGK